jgi:hypothetical protein
MIEEDLWCDGGFELSSMLCLKLEYVFRGNSHECLSTRHLLNMLVCMRCVAELS